MKIDIQAIKQRFGIIGNSPLMERAIMIAAQVATTDMSVLVTGESGVGKEFFPQIIHQFSPRKHRSYISVNCGAIPEGTVDSELFGHRKGSFTGALADRKGYFEEANGGTIFLDEIGELPLPTQARLLRVLETGEFIPVGASQAQRTDVRIVAATNVNLREAVRKGQFREDLLFRLDTVPIEVPALRQRPEDVPLLFRRFAADNAERYLMPALRLDEEARLLLMKYRWPGNVRELRNITDRMSILEEERMLSAAALRKYLHEDGFRDYLPAVMEQPSDGDTAPKQGYEREFIYQVLYEMRSEMAELKKLIGKQMAYQPQENIHWPVEDLSDRESIAHSWVDNSNYDEELEKQKRPLLVHADVDEQHETLSRREAEELLIRRALERHDGKRKPAAEELEISERTLYRKIKEYGI